MQLKQTVSPSAGRRLVPASVLNARQAACSRPLQRRSPSLSSDARRVVPGGLAQQPRLQHTTQRAVVTHGSHNDGLEVRPWPQQPTASISRVAAAAAVCIFSPVLVLLFLPSCRHSTLGRCLSGRSWLPTVARLPSGCSGQEQSWACARWVKLLRCFAIAAHTAAAGACKR